MHNVFDHLGRGIGLSALGPCGSTVAEAVIAPDARRADLRHEPDPARAHERALLGLLGRIASILCLIEMYSGSPDEDETLACLGKLIAFRQDRQRDAHKKKPKGMRKPEPFVKPFVWIITARRPTAVLAALAAIRARGWPRGVYFSPGKCRRDPGLDGAGGLLRVGVVVASELPRNRSTLLVRFLAAGPLLAEAIAELARLPADAHERDVADQILLNWEHVLESKSSRTPEEQEFIVAMHSTWEDAREQGRDEGGRAHARAMLRRVLSMRQLAPRRKDEAQIDGCDDLGTLDRWIEQAMTAESVAEALRANGTGTAGRATGREQAGRVDAGAERAR